MKLVSNLHLNFYIVSKNLKLKKRLTVVSDSSIEDILLSECISKKSEQYTKLINLREFIFTLWENRFRLSECKYLIKRNK